MEQMRIYGAERAAEVAGRQSSARDATHRHGCAPVLPRDVGTAEGMWGTRERCATRWASLGAGFRGKYRNKQGSKGVCFELAVLEESRGKGGVFEAI